MSTPSTAPRRPDSLTVKGGSTRQRILEAAADLMHEHGAGATTVQEVRSAARVSASQLYHYFGDKQALVRAVVEHQGARMRTGQEAAAIASLADLHRWRDDVLAAQREQLQGCPLGTLGSELAETDPTGRALAATEFDRWHAAITTGLDRMRDAGELPDDADTADLALALLAGLQGGLLLSHVTQSIVPLRSALDAMLSHVESIANPRH